MNLLNFTVTSTITSKAVTLDDINISEEDFVLATDEVNASSTAGHHGLRSMHLKLF